MNNDWNKLQETYMNEVVKEFNNHKDLINNVEMLPQKDIDHILQVGCDILLARDGHITSGSFSMAVVRNDLETAITAADSVSSKALKFFVYLKKWVKTGITSYEQMT